MTLNRKIVTMPRPKQPCSISMSMQTHEKLKRYAQEKKVTMASIVQNLVDREIPPPPKTEE